MGGKSIGPALKAATFGLAYMAPGLSVLAIFALVFERSYAAIPLSYLLAGAIMIITAVAFGELVKVFPGAGSVWDFAKKAANYPFAQFAIWLYLLQLVVNPAAATIPFAFYGRDLLGGFPTWGVVLICVAVAAILAIVGFKLSLRTIVALLAAQLIVLFWFSGVAINWAAGQGLISQITSVSFSPSGTLLGIAGVIAGASIAAFAFHGFEAPASLAEEKELAGETKAQVTRSIPMAILLAAGIGTVLYVFFGWAFSLAVPSIGLLNIKYINPVPTMAQAILGGQWWILIDIAGMIAGFTCALVSITAVSRVLFAMARDGLIPKFFAQKSNRFDTPHLAIIAVAVVTLLISEFVPWEVVAFTIVAGALPTFIITNFLSIWYYRKQGWTASNIVVHGILPAIGIVLCFVILLVGLPMHIKMLLLVWVALGFVFVAVQTLRSRLAAARLGSEVPAGVGTGVAWLVASMAGLGASIVVYQFWNGFYGSSADWWVNYFPYTWGDFTGQAVTAIAAVAGIGALVWVYLASQRKEEAYEPRRQAQ